MGIKGWLALACVLVLAALACVALWFRGEMIDAQRALAVAKADVETLQTSNSAHEKALDRLSDALAANDKLLTERESRINDILSARETVRRAWQKAVEDDQATRDWDRTVHPAGVRGVLASPPGGVRP